MQNKNIGFIGGGNMAASLIGGLIADGYPAERIRVADPDPARRARLEEAFHLATGDDNGALAEWADVLALAVKPQVMHTVCENLAPVVTQHRPLVLSVAAGLRSADIDRWLGGDNAVVRTMPNTPALVKSGATALFANPRVSNGQRELAENVMRAVGLTLWLRDEALMDAVTALSGSGPAYIFLVIELMEQAGTRLGLEPETARLLAVQTAFGAAKMVLESDDDPATLRQRVTSPGGTTEQALKRFEEGNLGELFEQALGAARDRARELADMLGAK